MIPFLLAAHLCGTGPVTLSMTLPADCLFDLSCVVDHPATSDPDAYRIVCPCQPVGYGAWTSEFQSWSDWPECSGWKL